MKLHLLCFDLGKTVFMQWVWIRQVSDRGRPRIAAIGQWNCFFAKEAGPGAWIGNGSPGVPRGRQTKLLGISKRGIRTYEILFVQGARSVVQQRHKQAPGLSSWLAQLLARAHQRCVIWPWPISWFA